MKKLTLVIANRNYSSWSLRPWLALKQTKAAFEEVVIALDRPETKAEILRYSPTGRVPVLLSGDLRIWDSLAICEYLAEVFPEAKLWPEDQEARAVARAVSAEMHSGFSDLRNTMNMNLRRRIHGVVANAAVQADIDRATALLTETRGRFGKGGPFLFGTFTNADAMYAPLVSRFRTYGVKTNDVVKAYEDAVFAHPSMMEWVRLSEAEPWSIEKYEVAGTAKT